MFPHVIKTINESSVIVPDHISLSETLNDQTEMQKVKDGASEVSQEMLTSTALSKKD